MADRTEIEWTDATWNPITGCSVVSPGCKHCYAMRLAGGRLKNHPSRRGLTGPTAAGPVWNGKVRWNEKWLPAPLKWKEPKRIFVCAHGDLFHESVPLEWIDRIHAVMGLAPHHVFQVLTKRSERMMRYYNDSDMWQAVHDMAHAVMIRYGRHYSGPEWLPLLTFTPLNNVWLGVSVEDGDRVERIHHLKATPAALRFVSFEPLLEDVSPLDLRDLDWAIAGGESGPRARRMDPEWVRMLRDHCCDKEIAFFFKQWGGPRPKSAGRLLDGVLHDSIPERADKGSWRIPLQGGDRAFRMLHPSHNPPHTYWGPHRRYTEPWIMRPRLHPMPWEH